MFTCLSNKIKEHVQFIILFILFVHMSAIFAIYVNALYNDYSDKAFHICSKLAKHVETRLETVEDSFASFIDNMDSNVNIPSPDLINQCSRFLSVTPEVFTIFGFDQNNTMFYRSSEQHIFSDFVSKMADFSQTTPWNIHSSLPEHHNYLLYTHSANNSIKMTAVLDTNAILNSFDSYHNSFTDTITISLCSYNGTLLPLRGKITDLSNTYYSDIYTESKKTYYFCSIPLKQNNLSLQFTIKLNQLILNISMVAIFFLLIFLLSWFLIHKLLLSYSQFLNYELTSLTKNIDNFTQERQETHHAE